MKIAIVGSGIFGLHIAITLAKKGFKVSVFDKKPTILSGSSLKNQLRLHRGFHYPRSINTAIQCLSTVDMFENTYPEAINKNSHQYYAISNKNSLTSEKEYKRFLDKLNQTYKETSIPFIKNESVSYKIESNENLLNIEILKEILLKEIKRNNVNLKLNHKVNNLSEISEYDKIILTTYGQEASILGLNHKYQFEICEKPVVKLPSIFRNSGCVILDGNFMCVDPLSGTDYHLLGNVTKAIHHSNTGYFPEIPMNLKEYVENDNLIVNPKFTKIDLFIEEGKRYFPEISFAQHVGSYFTVKAVLPKKDQTDERITIVEEINDKVINVFSGKLTHCIKAANQVLSILLSEKY